jgi:hypothetical protein
MNYIERRRHRRERADAEAELIWKEEAGSPSFESGRIVDFSKIGAGIDLPQPVPVSSCVILMAPKFGIIVLSQVRNCYWHRSQYRLGLEFLESVADQSGDAVRDSPCRELVKAGVAGDNDRLERLYRSLAFRYHPDNAETGDRDIFLRVKEAYRILSAPARIESPELGVARRGDSSGGTDIRELADKRNLVLRLLLQRRMTDYQNAYMSAPELESLTGFPAHEIGFILWYLREKAAVLTADYSTDCAITAAGVDLLEKAGREAAQAVPGRRPTRPAMADSRDFDGQPPAIPPAFSPSADI